MKILFTGDLGFRNITGITAESASNILSELSPALKEVDCIIPNLETPLADKEKYSPIKKSGPNLIGTPDNILFLKIFGADGVTLANNHIGDFGEGAVEDTLSLLDENGISHAGAGANSEAAYKAMHFEKNGICVAVISVCENEFGMATKHTWGSAGYEPRLLMRQIQEEKLKSNSVVVVFHGGNEYNPLPSPDTVNRYRLICDMGADAVIGGHTHCPQGYEYYDGKPIVYSMGNFLFKSGTERTAENAWYYGYMSVLGFGEKITLEIIPYKFNKEATKITVFDGDDKAKMLEYIETLCNIIKDEDELKNYFKGWAWHHRWIPEAPTDYSKPSGYNVCANMNLIFCEAHLSQARTVFEILYHKENKLAQKYEEKIRQLQKMPI